MRRIIVLVHLFAAALIAPAFILVGASGGLYLIGIKGEVETTKIPLTSQATVDFASATLEQDIAVLLKQLGIQHDYEYLKIRGKQIVTRPTSRTYYELKHDGQTLSLTKNQPSLQKRMIELHKGHGPTAFKTYQKFVAAGLLLVVLSGLWTGLNSPAWRRKTIAASLAGLVIFLVLAFS